MRRRSRSRRRSGRIQFLAAATCYGVAAACVFGAGWVALGLAGDDDEASTVPFTMFTTTSAPPLVPAAATPPVAPAPMPIAAPPAVTSAPPRPVASGNAAPTISGPSSIAVALGATVRPQGIVVDDLEARGGGSMLLLVIGIGVDLHLPLDEQAGYAGEQSPQWQPIGGSLDGLNRSLAGLEVTRTAAEARIVVYVEDRGHGDVSKAEFARLDIAVHNP